MGFNGFMWSRLQAFDFATAKLPRSMGRFGGFSPVVAEQAQGSYNILCSPDGCNIGGEFR
jgi:hypothetical protein